MPYHQAYVPTDTHPFSRRLSSDISGIHGERVAMNGLMHQMMGWGSGWAQKLGGDTQHQVLQVELQYIDFLHGLCVPRDSNGSVRDW